MMSSRVAVVLASAGRSELLGRAVADIDGQTRIIAVRVLSVPDRESLPDPVPEGWRVVTGVQGSAAQRNAGIEAVRDTADIVFFFDDDAVPRTDYIDMAMRFFADHLDVVGITGRVLLDGASHSEIPRQKAVAALSASQNEPPSDKWHRTSTLYGCNCAYRLAAAGGLQFDQRLPLYSWLEDHDFARRLMRRGSLAHVDDCVVVHLGTASGGRTNHVRLGYSQVMNPLYLHTTGSFPLWLSAWQIFRPVAKNLACSLLFSRGKWRRQRLKGNLLATHDALAGRITPERITEL